MIDTHIHAVSSSLPGLKPKPPEIEKLYQSPLQAMADSLKAEMAAGKAEIAFGIGSLGGHDRGSFGDRSHPRFVQLGARAEGDRRRRPETQRARRLKAVEAQIDGNCAKIVAFKAYLGYLHFGPEDPNYVPYYRLAAKYDLPVIVHTGDNWSTTAKVKYAHPLRMDEVAVDFPERPIRAGPLRQPLVDRRGRGRYSRTRTSGPISRVYSSGSDQEIQAFLGQASIPDSVAGLLFSDLKKAIGYVGDYNKFVYGSDWPLAPMGAYRRLIESAIPREHHQAVFRTNAKQVFKV